MIWKSAVKLAVHDFNFKLLESIKNCRSNKTAHAIGRVGYNSQLAYCRDIDEPNNMIHEFGKHIFFGNFTRRFCIRRSGSINDILSNRFHLAQTIVNADGSCARQTTLDAVVLGRIMRSGEHRPWCI